MKNEVRAGAMHGTTQRTRWASLAFAAILALCAVPGAAGAQAGSQPGTPAARSAVPFESVKSQDGTTIAYEKSGAGPVLILVSSALSARKDFVRLAALLAPQLTVVNYDRRGRGDSSDTQPYAVLREIEDIEALIDALGGKAFLFGSSSGAVLALEAAARLPGKVQGAVLFEPPFVVDASRPPVPDDLAAELRRLVAADQRGEAVAYFMSKAIGVPDDYVAQMKQMPMWRGMEGLAHTLAYDGTIMAGMQAGKPLSKTRWASAVAPMLVIHGELSDPFLQTAARALAEVLPDARSRVLEGQDHSAPFMAPESFLPMLPEFFGSLTKGEIQR